MPTKRTPAEPAVELMPPEWTLPALKKQLECLQLLKGRNYNEADGDETEWHHLTQSIIERGFGRRSSNMMKFSRASSSGTHVMTFGHGIDHRQNQANFETRIREHEAVLKSLIAEIKLVLPEDEIKGNYKAGEEYAFYRDLKRIIEPASREILIVDNYVDDQIFDIYVNRVGSSVQVRLLTHQISSVAQVVAVKYARGHGAFELRTSNGVHDRIVFVDDRCWVIGQSIKDAASKKPTYMIEVDHSTWRPIYEDLWTKAARVI